MNKTNETVERLKNYLSIYGRKYPNAWKQFDEFREMRGSGESFEWNDSCFCPLAGAYAIVSGGGYLSPDNGTDIGILGGLAAWRTTQGIYRFDETVFEAVWATPVTGDLPVEVFFYLPEWCVYIETPGKQFGGDELLGFFVYLDDDRKNLRDELRFILDCRNGLIPYPIHLQKTGLAASIRSVAEEAAFQSRQAGIGFEQNFLIQNEIKNQIEPLISLTLYLCSQTSEIADYENRRPPDYHKKQQRIYPPQQSRQWEVGFRLGASVRSAIASERAAEQTGRTPPRPHIRRAHWHGFWTGSRDKKQKFVLKWLPPAAVNVNGSDFLIPVLKEIE